MIPSSRSVEGQMEAILLDVEGFGNEWRVG